MNNDFHQLQKYQKYNEYQFINNMFFGAKKKEINKVEDTSGKDLELITIKQILKIKKRSVVKEIPKK